MKSLTNPYVHCDMNVAVKKYSVPPADNWLVYQLSFSNALSWHNSDETYVEDDMVVLYIVHV